MLNEEVKHCISTKRINPYRNGNPKAFKKMTPEYTLKTDLKILSNISLRVQIEYGIKHRLIGWDAESGSVARSYNLPGAGGRLGSIAARPHPDATQRRSSHG